MIAGPAVLSHVGSVSLTPLVNVRHWSGVKINVGPSGFLESRRAQARLVAAVRRSGARLVHRALSRWGLAALAEDAELVVSGIVTNSVKATGLADAGPEWADPGDLASIQVRVLLFPAAVIIEVWDRDPAGPVRQAAMPDEEGGRGLAIVGNGILSKRDSLRTLAGGHFQAKTGCSKWATQISRPYPTG